MYALCSCGHEIVQIVIDGVKVWVHVEQDHDFMHLARPIAA